MAHPEASGTTMTPDPHIDTIGPLALACLRGEPLDALRDAIAETGWTMPADTVAPVRDEVWAIIVYWRECQATAALRAALPGGGGTYVHETPRPG
jgi:hypothetical protein